MNLREHTALRCCLCLVMIADRRKRKRLHTDQCAEAREVLLSLSGQDVLQSSMLQDPRAVLCGVCQRDLCKIASLTKEINLLKRIVITKLAMHRQHQYYSIGVGFGATHLQQSSDVQQSEVLDSHSAGATQLQQSSDVQQSEVLNSHSAGATQLQQSSDVQQSEVLDSHSAGATQLQQSSDVQQSGVLDSHSAGATQLQQSSDVQQSAVLDSHSAGATQLQQSSDVQQSEVLDSHSAGAIYTAPAVVRHSTE